MSQAYTNLEILLVDDGSTDGSAEIARELCEEDERVFLITAPVPGGRRYSRSGTNINAGFSARNTGLEIAKGEWITFQDADDWSHVRRISTQLAICNDLNAKHLTTSYVKSTDPAANLFDDPIKAPPLRYRVEDALLAPQLAAMATHQLGLLSKALPEPVFACIPWEVKIARPVRVLFFRRFDPYPGAAGSVFFHRTVAQKFMPLQNRRWPSPRGRGADRDFSYRVAMEEKQSAALQVALYVWDTQRANRT